MSVERETAKTLHLKLEEPVEIQKLKEILEQARIRTQECAALSPPAKPVARRARSTDQQKFLYRKYIQNREFNRPRGTVGHRPAHRRP